MASIAQLRLFSWKDIDDLGDLERLNLIINTMPDEYLMQTLEKLRGFRGRNDYPIRAVWNSILAGIVYQHPSIESLRRELQRNAQLREICGFDPLKGHRAVPSKDAYSRFLDNLMNQQKLIDLMFEQLVSQITELLPDFGKNIAFDSKAIESLSPCPSSEKDGDRRREEDADYGKKTYKGIKEDNTTWEKVKTWFGYKLHLIVDANYELPISYELTKASCHDVPVMRDMFDKLEFQRKEMLEHCEAGMGDKGYDDVKLISQLFGRYMIKPIIDIRNNWKDSDKTRIFPSRQIDNLTYDYKGTIYCHCQVSGEVRKMVYAGFENDRNTLKYRCPAREYGIKCKGASKCPLAKGVRISVQENIRYFTPLPRSTYKWKRLYNKRTSVERVNSRLDVSFGFEKHYIRGMDKMRTRCGLTLCIMIALAVGRIKQKNPELMRSLVKAA